MEMVYNDEMIVARIKSEFDKLKRGDLPKTAFTISASNWTLENDRYTTNISASVTVDDYIEVFFDDSCNEIVTAAKIATEGETTANAIKISAENLLTDSISGSFYIFKGNSFMSKTRVNVIENIAVNGVNVSIDNKTGIADVVINSSVAAGVENVSVIGGEINASINNRTLYLYAPAKSSLKTAKNAFKLQ